MKRVMVAGGSGNAGRRIVDLLAVHSDAHIVVAGRDEIRARATAARLALPRVSGRGVDLTDAGSLRRGLSDIDLLVVAAGTAPQAPDVVRACVAAHCDYLDIQVSGSKVRLLRQMDPIARDAGIRVVTDGGFHPGLPAAMIRQVAARLPGLESATVGSVIAMDWAALQPLARSTVRELMAEFRDYAYEEYRGGRWVPARRARRVRFPPPFLERPCAAMGLAEMHEVCAALPSLRESGFYVGGFNPVVDRGVIPLCWVGMKIAPDLVERPLGDLLYWGLRKFSAPPFGTVLQLDGAERGAAPEPLLRVSHPDAYFLTAAPTVATVLQLLDGTISTPGVQVQAMAVTPERLFADLARFGVDVSMSA